MRSSPALCVYTGPTGPGKIFSRNPNNRLGDFRLEPQRPKEGFRSNLKCAGMANCKITLRTLMRPLFLDLSILMSFAAYICTWRTQRSSLALLLCACFILCVWNLGWMQGHQHAPFQSHGATGLYNRARQDMTTTAKLPSADSKENSSFTAIKNSEAGPAKRFLAPDKNVEA